MISNPKNEFERMFGEYPDGFCFEIEHCLTLKKINDKAKKDEGIKIAEFLLLDIINNKTTISIIEAKTSAPQNTDEYIDEIREKFTNSLSLFVAIYSERHIEHSSEMPDAFKQIKLSEVHFKLILAIQKQRKEWLPPIQDKLKQALKKTVRIWNPDLISVIVLNEAGARKHGLLRTEPVSS